MEQKIGNAFSLYLPRQTRTTMPDLHYFDQPLPKSPLHFRMMRVLIRNTIFTMHPKLRHFQSLNPPEKLLASQSEAEQDAFFRQMLKDILAVLG
ncbi:MAG: hypothetical protein ABMA02_15490 [Saprospiraceae bacterium]